MINFFIIIMLLYLNLFGVGAKSFLLPYMSINRNLSCRPIFSDVIFHAVYPSFIWSLPPVFPSIVILKTFITTFSSFQHMPLPINQSIYKIEFYKIWKHSNTQITPKTNVDKVHRTVLPRFDELYLMQIVHASRNPRIWSTTSVDLVNLGALLYI